MTWRRAAVLGLLLLALAIPAALAGELRYVASRLRAPFHKLSCRWAAEIAPENAVYYETREQAIRDGHRPCRVCDP